MLSLFSSIAKSFNTFRFALDRLVALETKGRNLEQYQIQEYQK